MKSEIPTFDVRGSYVINCLEIEHQWDEQGDLTLETYLENQNGKLQLFGVFDIRAIKGIMRFEKPVLDPKDKPTARRPTWRYRWLDGAERDWRKRD